MVADKKMPQFKTSALKEDSGIVNVPMLAAEVPIHVTCHGHCHITSRHVTPCMAPHLSIITIMSS